VPIRFNAGRIVGTDFMYLGRFLRKLNRKLVLAPASGMTSADLIMPTGLEKINKTKFRFDISFRFTAGGRALLRQTRKF